MKTTTPQGWESQEQLDAHLVKVAARLAHLTSPEGLQELQDVMDKAAQAMDRDAANEAIEKAQRSPSLAGRVTWIRKAAEVYGQGVAGVSPCKAGCSHCCHIAVTVGRAEAELIAKNLGIRLHTPKRDRLIGEHTFKERDGVLTAFNQEQLDIANTIKFQPCPFLKGGKCGIYKERPMACRLHWNADVDDLLCKLVPGDNIETRYFNATQIMDVMVAWDMQTPSKVAYADIRDWFPKGLG